MSHAASRDSRVDLTEQRDCLKGAGGHDDLKSATKTTNSPNVFGFRVQGSGFRGVMTKRRCVSFRGIMTKCRFKKTSRTQGLTQRSRRGDIKERGDLKKRGNLKERGITMT